MSQVVAFLDTMILLEYKPLKEWDWRALFDGQDVRLVVARTVMDELDKHKDQHPRAGTKKRARERLSAIKEMCAGKLVGSVADGFEIEVILGQPRDRFAEFDLDRGSGDDRLLMAALQYRDDHPESTVALVTLDIPASMLAAHHGLQVLEPPYDLRLTQDSDPLEQENKALQKELDEYRRAAPSLSVVLDNGSTSTSVHLTEFAEHKEDYTYQHYMSRTKKLVHPGLRMKSTGMIDYGGEWVSAEEAKRYEGEATAYIEALTKGLDEAYKHEVFTAHLISLRLVLKNDGSAHAHHVGVEVRVLQEAALFGEGCLPEAPVLPKVPEKPAGLLGRVGRLDLPRRTVAQAVESEQPFWRRTPDGRLLAQIDSLFQGRDLALPTVYLVPEPVDPAGSTLKVIVTVVAQGVPKRAQTPLEVSYTYEPRPPKGTELIDRLIAHYTDRAPEPDLAAPFPTHRGSEVENLPWMAMQSKQFEDDPQIKELRELGYSFSLPRPNTMAAEIARGYEHVVWKAPDGTLYRLCNYLPIEDGNVYMMKKTEG